MVEWVCTAQKVKLQAPVIYPYIAAAVAKVSLDSQETLWVCTAQKVKLLAPAMHPYISVALLHALLQPLKLVLFHTCVYF